MDELDHLGWVAQRSFEIGNTLVGVRTNSEGFVRWLDEALGDYAADEETDPFYSVHLADGEPSPSRVGKPMHVLYAEEKALVRTFDLSLLTRALIAEFESFLHEERDDALYLGSDLVFRGNSVALVPPLVVPYLATMGRGVARSGVSLPEGRTTVVDPETGRAVPIRPRLRVPTGALPRLGGVSGAGAGGRQAPAERSQRVRLDGPVRVDVVCSIGLHDELLEPLHQSAAMFTHAQHARNLRRLGPHALDGLSRLIEGARCYQVRSGSPREMLQGLVAALDGT
jgi:hypothetical protein